MIVKTESSKYELAHSVSTSIKAGLTLFKISASIKYGFESETSSSKEMAYTAVLAICRREKQYLDPNLDDKLATLRSALQSGFARDLNGQEAVISLPDKFGNISPYHVIPQDLNKGTKALSNVDLCYTRGSNHTPVTTIGADLNADCPSNEWEIVTWAGAREPADLNFQTTKHKKSIHLIMKHAGNIRDDLTGAKLCGLDGLDNSYKPITDVKVMTSEDYTALCAKDKSYESYKGVVDTETRKAEPLFWTKESGLWIWIKRATSFDWSSIAP